MKTSRLLLSAWLLAGLAFLPSEGRADAKRAQAPQEGESEAARVVVDRIITRENKLAQILQDYRPRVESYLQSYRADAGLEAFPVSDHYFLGRLEFDSKVGTRSFLASPQPKFGLLSRVFGGFGIIARPFRFQFELDTFAQAALVDYRGLDRKHYRFQFVRSEFLGAVRCLVFDVIPEQRGGTGRFKGRIWVEDHDFTIVRFKGVRLHPPKFHVYLHFDSWRQNLQPGLWLPVYTFVEETDLDPPTFLDLGSGNVAFRSQTRFWGYDLSGASREEELTRILVEAQQPVRDSSEATDLSPLASERRWETEAENNVLERLEKAGLIAPAGEVDQVLETVVNNLMVTNHLDNLPTVRCRVMMTLPFESFTIGHTIVLSRGLIDVLPDEATLAAVLAHELAHLAEGHKTNTKYAFSDRLLISDEELLAALDFARDADEESAADARGVQLLDNSPYKDSLGNASLFLQAMANVAPRLRQLFGAHLGNRMADGSKMLRMVEMTASAPPDQPSPAVEIVALPLGSRVKVDAWSGRVELMKSKPVAPLTAKEKMPFLVTPLFPYLTRVETSTAPATAGQRATAEGALPQK